LVGQNYDKLLYLRALSLAIRSTPCQITLTGNTQLELQLITVQTSFSLTNRCIPTSTEPSEYSILRLGLGILATVNVSFIWQSLYHSSACHFSPPAVYAPAQLSAQNLRPSSSYSNTSKPHRAITFVCSSTQPPVYCHHFCLILSLPTQFFFYLLLLTPPLVLPLFIVVST
jgi:hypothetical protein